ncbi:MAG: prepilin-type N-terminal cleavage/methylation domain-containing protein [Candidatus Paceibacterota bacterium]|jgi:type II secretion system protein G
MKTKRQKGFTLIELLVVISIIGLLSTVVLASLTSARKKAEAAKFVAEMKQLKTAFELYRNDNGGYPGGLNFDSCYPLSGSCQDAKIFLINELVNKKYIQSVPQIDNFNEFYYSAGATLDQTIGQTRWQQICGGRALKAWGLFFVYPNIPINDFDVWEAYVYENGQYQGSNTFDGFYCIGE